MIRRIVFAGVLAALCAAGPYGRVGQAAEAGKSAGAPASQSQPSAMSQYFGFKPMEILKLNYGLSTPIVVDVNGDGLNDLVLINNQKSRVELLLQRRSFDPDAPPVLKDEDDVNDIFGQEQTWRFVRASFPLDVAAASLVVTDINGDGRPDLAYYAKNGLYVALQTAPKASSQPSSQAAPGGGNKEKAPSKAPAGSPTPAKGAASAPTGAATDKPVEPQWLPPVKIDITEGLPQERALAAGDLDGDGRPDLAVLANDGVWVTLQKKDGTFAPTVKYPSGGQRLRELRLADVNHDGRCDMILLAGEQEYPVRVRLQNARGQLGPELRLELPYPSVFEVADLGRGTAARGRCDFLTVTAQSGRVVVSTFAPNPAKQAFPVYTYPLPATEGAGDRDITAADVNGDGLLDVVATDPSRAEFLLFLANANDTLSPAQRFPGMQDMRKLAPARTTSGPASAPASQPAGAADRPADGADAIVALSLKEKLIGISRFQDGRLTYPSALPVTGEPLAMDVADIDGDGRPDVAYVAKEKNKYVLRTLLDIASAAPKAGAELELTELADKPQDLRAADIDQDGKVEFMIFRPYGAVVLVRRQEGKLAEVSGKDLHAGLVSNVDPATVSLAPLGPNGSTALLVAQKEFARALVFDLTKGWQVADQYTAPGTQGNVSAATCAALGADDTQSLFAYDAVRGRLSIMDRQKDGTYQTASDLDVGAMPVKRIFAGDFGGMPPTIAPAGKGAADAKAPSTREAPHRISVLLAGPHKLILVPVAARTHVLRKIAGYEPAGHESFADSRYGDIAVGDLNGDGLADLVLCEQAKHHVQVLSFDAAGDLKAAIKFKVFEEARPTERRWDMMGRESGEPRAAAVGDVTGDGKNDLILLVHDRLIVYPQD